MRCAILLKSKVTCDQLKKAASFLNTGGHDISDVFEPRRAPYWAPRYVEKYHIAHKKTLETPYFQILKWVKWL